MKDKAEKSASDKKEKDRMKSQEAKVKPAGFAKPTKKPEDQKNQQKDASHKRSYATIPNPKKKDDGAPGRAPPDPRHASHINAAATSNQHQPNERWTNKDGWVSNSRDSSPGATQGHTYPHLPKYHQQFSIAGFHPQIPDDPRLQNIPPIYPGYSSYVPYPPNLPLASPPQARRERIDYHQKSPATTNPQGSRFAASHGTHSTSPASGKKNVHFGASPSPSPPPDPRLINAQYDYQNAREAAEKAYQKIEKGRKPGGLEAWKKAKDKQTKMSKALEDVQSKIAREKAAKGGGAGHRDTRSPQAAQGGSGGTPVGLGMPTKYDAAALAKIKRDKEEKDRKEKEARFAAMRKARQARRAERK